MRKTYLLFAALGLGLLLLSAQPARADHRLHRRGRVVIDTPRVIVVAPGTSLAHRPPGWDHGRKVGWGNCDLPPGLAKKYGCGYGFLGRDRRVYRRSGVVIRLPGRVFLDLR